MLMRTARKFPAAAVAIALWGAGALPARADDDADRHAAAATVLDVLHSGEMVGNIVPAITAQVRLNLTHNDATLGRQFDDLAPKLRADAEAQKPALMDKLVDLYARTFTLAELNDMLGYYTSPVGQRIIATQGAINRDMLAAARDWGNVVAKTMLQSAAAELQGKPPAP